MIIQYMGFILTLLWSYTFIKTQGVFKKGSGILITIFVSNISWLTFITACYYGLKTFTFYYFLCGLVFSVVFVQLVFSRLSLHINSKFKDKNKLMKLKTFVEYLIISLFIYFIFF